MVKKILEEKPIPLGQVYDLLTIREESGINYVQRVTAQHAEKLSRDAAYSEEVIEALQNEFSLSRILAVQIVNINPKNSTDVRAITKSVLSVDQIEQLLERYSEFVTRVGGLTEDEEPSGEIVEEPKEEKFEAFKTIGDLAINPEILPEKLAMIQISDYEKSLKKPDNLNFFDGNYSVYLGIGKYDETKTKSPAYNLQKKKHKEFREKSIEDIFNSPCNLARLSEKQKNLIQVEVDYLGPKNFPKIISHGQAYCKGKAIFNENNWYLEDNKTKAKINKIKIDNFMRFMHDFGKRRKDNSHIFIFFDIEDLESKEEDDILYGIFFNYFSKKEGRRISKYSDPTNFEEFKNKIVEIARNSGLRPNEDQHKLYFVWYGHKEEKMFEKLYITLKDEFGQTKSDRGGFGGLIHKFIQKLIGTVTIEEIIPIDLHTDFIDPVVYLPLPEKSLKQVFYYFLNAPHEIIGPDEGTSNYRRNTATSATYNKKIIKEWMLEEWIKGYWDEEQQKQRDSRLSIKEYNKIDCYSLYWLVDYFNYRKEIRDLIKDSVIEESFEDL